MIAIKRHSRPHSGRIEHVGNRLPGASRFHETPAPTDDYLRLVGEVTALRQKQVQIGVAVILGDIDKRVCAELKKEIDKLADYVSYANWGPFVVVAFQRCLFEQLKPMWQELLINAPGIAAGIAFPWDDAGTQELVTAARLALGRAIDSHYDLVALNEDEAMAAVVIRRMFGATGRASASRRIACNESRTVSC